MPYARIQNLDGVENVIHRLLGVVDVRVETGGGAEPEARISVLRKEAFAEMRRRVFEGRAEQARAAVDSRTEDTAVQAPTTLLQLSVRDLLLYGLLESRGLVVIGAVYGLLWELGLLDRLWGRLFEDERVGRGLVRSLVRSAFEGGSVPWRQVVLAIAGIAVLLLVARVASMIWAGVRLYGFRLTRMGDDLRTEFGLFTRVTATIPIRRIQTLTLRQSPLQRLMDRTSVRVATAGGREIGTGSGSRERQWLAPIIRSRDCPELVSRLLSELDLTTLDWRPPHARAFRRAIRPAIVLALLPALLVWGAAGTWALAVLVAALVWNVFAARRYIAHLRWAATDHIVVLASGWLWRHVTVARVAKIQAVTSSESPFDRRWAMAVLRVDTAGAGEASQRVAIPYLARTEAQVLRRQLASRAASTAFRW